jgi:hypothetical protein
MLEHGSIIHVVANDSTSGIKFIVRFPSRDGYQAQYMQNLFQYCCRVQEMSKKPGDADFLNLGVRAGNMQRRDTAGFIIPQQVGNSHGMHWNGGSIYNVTGQIGKGAFATVYKLATKNDGALFAAKELDKRRLMKNNILDHKWDNEMKIMKGLRHVSLGESLLSPILLKLTTSGSPTSSNSGITMSMIAGSISLWNTFRAVNLVHILTRTTSYLKTLLNPLPARYCMRCNTFTDGR